MLRADEKCEACGIPTPTLQIARLSGSSSDHDDIEQYVVLCPNCHARLDQFSPRDLEFVSFLGELLLNNSKFKNVQNECDLGDSSHLRADFLATRAGTAEERLVIEAKRWSFVRPSDAIAAVEQLTKYQRAARADALALAFPGRVSKSAREILVQAGIEVWDIDYIAEVFADELAHSTHENFKFLYQIAAGKYLASPPATLLARLDACPKGKSHWAEFQRIVRDALELLFCPPLAKPIWESSDLLAHNRRDIILPNEAETGFWLFLRERYAADYIVVDPKNYANPITKPQVLQIANYLKAHGTGLFALIFARSGSDKGAQATCREQWALYGKLILVLSDEDLKAMLLASSSGGRPEEVISRLIQDFRLKM